MEIPAALRAVPSPLADGLPVAVPRMDKDGPDAGGLEESAIACWKAAMMIMRWGATVEPIFKGEWRKFAGEGIRQVSMSLWPREDRPGYERDV